MAKNVVVKSSYSGKREVVGVKNLRVRKKVFLYKKVNLVKKCIFLKSCYCKKVVRVEKYGCGGKGK